MIPEWDDGDGAVLPEHHEKVLEFIVNAGRPVTRKEVERFLVENTALSPGSASWLLRDLIEMGFVEKLTKGLYGPTEKGLSYMGYRDPAKLISEAMEDIAKVAIVLARHDAFKKEHAQLLEAYDLLHEVIKWFDKAAPRPSK